MTLSERIEADLKAAMLARDSERTSALRMIRAEVLKKEKEKVGFHPDDAMMVDMLQSMAKQRRDSIEQFKNAGRDDLVKKEQADLECILSYLPEQMSDAELESEVAKAIAAVGAASIKDLGKVMGPLMKALKSSWKTIDGGKVQGMVKAKLGG